MFFIDKYVKRFSETKKKIIKNLFWAILGKCVGLFGNLIIGIFIARYLGPTQYGLMNYVISYVTIFTIISNFGLDNIEIRELSRNGDNKEMILGTSLGLRLLFSFIAFICVFFSVFLFDLEQESRILIIIYALSIFPSAFNLIRNYFTSIVLNEYVVKSEIIRTIIGASIKITLLLFNAPIILFIVAH